MKRKYILLINDKQGGTVCWKGEGTVGQVKGDIEELVGKKGIEPEMLDVIPVISSRLDPWKVGAVLGLIGLAGFVAYENLFAAHGLIRRNSKKKTSSHAD